MFQGLILNRYGLIDTLDRDISSYDPFFLASSGHLEYFLAAMANLGKAHSLVLYRELPFFLLHFLGWSFEANTGKVVGADCSAEADLVLVALLADMATVAWNANMHQLAGSIDYANLPHYRLTYLWINGGCANLWLYCFINPLKLIEWRLQWPREAVIFWSAAQHQLISLFRLNCNG